MRLGRRAAAAGACVLAAAGLLVEPLHAETPIVVAAPLSGPQSAEGAAIKTAAEWAVATINASGGIAGEKVELIAVDDHCLPSRAAEAASGVTAPTQSKRPALVVGHPCAGSAIAAARVYAAAGILFIATAPRHPDLTVKRAGPTTFRLAGRDDGQGAATGSYLAAAYAGRRIAIVHDRTHYARTLVEQVKSALAAAGQTPPPEFGIVASEKDYSATVTALAAVKADVIYFAGFPTEASTLWAQFKGSAAMADFIGADAIADAAVQRPPPVDKAGNTARKFQVVLPHTALDAAGAEPLAARLTAAGLKPTAAAIAAYAAIEVWAAAARDSGWTDDAGGTQRSAERLARAPLPSIIGPIVFDASGDARLPSFGVAHFADGKWTTDAVIQPFARGHKPNGRTGQREQVRVEQPLPDVSLASLRRPPLPVANPRRGAIAVRAKPTSTVAPGAVFAPRTAPPVQ